MLEAPHTPGGDGSLRSGLPPPSFSSSLPCLHLMLFAAMPEMVAVCRQGRQVPPRGPLCGEVDPRHRPDGLHLPRWSIPWSSRHGHASQALVSGFIPKRKAMQTSRLLKPHGNHTGSIIFSHRSVTFLEQHGLGACSVPSLTGA